MPLSHVHARNLRSSLARCHSPAHGHSLAHGNSPAYRHSPSLGKERRGPTIGWYRWVLLMPILLGIALGSALRSPLARADVAAESLACAELTGESVQGGLLWGKSAPGARITFGDRPVPVLPDGSFVLGLGRDTATEVSLIIETPARCEQVIQVSQRDYRLQRVNGVPQKTVTPPEEDLARIRLERERVRQAKALRLERPDLLLAVRTGLSWPAVGPISGVYGSQRIYNGTPGSPHYGVDVAVPTGHPVRAPGPGVVTLAEPDLYYSGGTVILDHGYGLSSSFLHMSAIHVSEGDEVAAGDLIGAVGATGRATGPHLDWRMSWFDERVDPQRLVPPMPKP